MKKKRMVVSALVAVAFGLAAGFLLPTKDVSGQGPISKGKIRSSGRVGGPLPPPRPLPDQVVLSPVEKLGKFLIFDTFLSNPPGYACSTCHTPQTGATGPSSLVNLIGGTMPGVVPGRYSNRKPQTYTYAAFSPIGPYFDNDLGVWIGGTFWDGRTVDLVGQAMQPPINPNEMANIPTNGIYPPPFGGYSALLVEKLKARPYTPLLKRVWGPNVFENFTPQQIYVLFAEALAAFQSSGEVCQFSSKWDASQYGTPPQDLYTLTASEERGRILYGVGPNPDNNPLFGQAQCFQCHDSTANLPVQLITQGKNTFTMYCYANIGVPRNGNLPYYAQTDCASNPFGCNSLGTNYIDYGLGDNPNPAPDGTVFNNPNTNAQFLGLFKAPPTRNSDLRPTADFVKAYMHNGVFKSLKQVVNFYNKRNIAVDANGNEMAFDLTVGPPDGFTPLFPPPEVLDNVQNVAGLTPAEAAAMGVSGVVATNGQVGNLGLTAQQEADVVNFLKILSDYYTEPNPVSFNP